MVKDRISKRKIGQDRVEECISVIVHLIGQDKREARYKGRRREERRGKWKPSNSRYNMTRK
jgi:hypothetical protein